MSEVIASLSAREIPRAKKPACHKRIYTITSRHMYITSTSHLTSTVDSNRSISHSWSSLSVTKAPAFTHFTTTNTITKSPNIYHSIIIIVIIDPADAIHIIPAITAVLSMSPVTFIKG